MRYWSSLAIITHNGLRTMHGGKSKTTSRHRYYSLTSDENLINYRIFYHGIFKF